MPDLFICGMGFGLLVGFVIGVGFGMIYEKRISKLIRKWRKA